MSTSATNLYLCFIFFGFASMLWADQAAQLAAIEGQGGMVSQPHENSSLLDIEFHLNGRGLTDEKLSHVAGMTNVVSLNLRGTRITDAGLAHLGGLSSLRYLHLEKTVVSNDGLRHLAKLHQLEYLNLYGTRVTDKGLQHLSGLHKLKRLYVWQTKVTKEGADQLQGKLPELRVIRGVDFKNLPKFAQMVPDSAKPTGELKWIATSKREDAPQSTNGENTTVHFVNKSKMAVRLYWISYGNELTLYATLQPGMKREQNSYENNTWLITDEKVQPLGYFIVGTEVSLAVIPPLTR